MTRRVWIAALVCFGTCSSTRSLAGSPTGQPPLPEAPAQVHLDCASATFDLTDPAGLSNLVCVTTALIELSDAQEARLKASRQRLLQSTALADLPLKQLHRFFADPEDYINRRERRGLKAMRSRAEFGLRHWGRPDQENWRWELAELAGAINNDPRPVVPARLDILEVPTLLERYFHNPVGKGTRPASNLSDYSELDLSRVDPQPSTFWSRPQAIRCEDLFAGYGRADLPVLSNCLWQYAAPKTSSGGTPGLRVRSGGTKLKIKFEEVSSEPFTARVFSALGYHTDQVDYVPFLKIAYDRRLLREFHMRKEFPIPVSFFRVRLGRFHYQQRYDPFQFVSAAVLKDGSLVSAQDLKRRLFRHPDRSWPEDDPANFQPQFERQIAYLITTPVSVEMDRKGVHSVGPWGFAQNGHQTLRELRGAALLAAWLSWTDSQFENTRLRLVEADGHVQLRHYFSDLGRGLGEGTGIYDRRGESPNGFAWFFTKPPVWQGKGRMRIPFRIVEYKPLVETAAFREMTEDDARWMARLIGQLTERQLCQGLVASGYDSAQARLYLEKLISRRDRMIRDLGLDCEIPPLRPGGANRDLTYHPVTDGPLSIRTAHGQVVQARVGPWAVSHGKLVQLNVRGR